MIRVTADKGAYDIHCKWGALADLAPHMRDAGLSGTAFVVTDSNVGPQFGERTLAALDAHGITAALFTIPAGEASKSLDTVREIYDWLLDHRAERSSAIISLGGGVVGDLTGFVASSYLRGVPFVQCPTSLLSMVDASIGGKVGVDHPRGKNLIGAFYPPRLVVQDTSLLASLPSRSLREGFAEAIKHGLIMDPPMLDILEHDAKRLLSVEPELTTELVARNAALKAKVVSEDEREGGLRMTLNYGHTIGHAIEAVTGYTSVLHGEAISVGMMAAAAIGERIGVTPPAIAERQRRLFELYGLPMTMPGLNTSAVMDATRIDKKVAGKKLRWVLLEDLGRPVIRDDVPDDVVADVLRTLFGG